MKDLDLVQNSCRKKIRKHSFGCCDRNIEQPIKTRKDFYMTQILGYIKNMIPYILITFPVLLIVRYGMYLLRKNKGVRINILHEIGIIFFILYLVGIASQTIIPKIEFSGTGVGIVGDVGINYSRINIIPFNKLTEVWKTVAVEGYVNYLLIEVLGNIAIFMVIGFMLPLLWSKFENLRKTLIACIGISVFIEILQLILPRATDIDDILMNAFG